MKRLQPSFKEDTIEEYRNPQLAPAPGKGLLKSGIRGMEDAGMHYDERAEAHGSDKRTIARGTVNGFIASLLLWVVGGALFWGLAAALH